MVICPVKQRHSYQHTISRTDRHTPRKSQRHQESASLSCPEHTQRYRLTQAQTCTPGHTHTHRVTKSLTHRQIQSNTQSHTEGNRHTQLHTGPWRPWNNGCIVCAGSSWGGRSHSVDGGGRGGCCTTPLTLTASEASSLFQKPDSGGPGFPEGLSSRMNLPQPPGTPGGRGRAPCGPSSPRGSGNSGSLSSDVPLSSRDLPVNPQCRAWKSRALGSALNL